MVVNPSLTKMTDLRPSRSPPSRAAAPLSAVITTWLRICSTVDAGIVGVALLELVARPVIEAAALEVLDRTDEARPVTGERQAGDRRERVHDRDHVQRGELVLDELDERLAHHHVVAAPHVIVIEEEDEQPDLRALGLALLLEDRA